MSKENYTGRELDYYELSLLQYLQEYHPEKAHDLNFIKLRADSAAEVYEQSRLEGYDISGAQELAMAELIRDLHFSKYYMVLNIIESEFRNEIPEDKKMALVKEMSSRLDSIFSRYKLWDEFEQTPEYNSLYNEITGEITLYLENYGI